MEPLKNMFSDVLIHDIAKRLHVEYPDFDTKKFLAHFKTNEWRNAELKERVRLTATAIHEVLSLPYKDAINVLLPVAQDFQIGFAGIVFPEYVMLFGQHDWEISIRALKEFTKSSTSEFAIRPFIIEDSKKAMATLLKWSTDPNEHVRRLSSEGCRPRLPWGMQLTGFVKDPTPILPILENLKNDSALYVRKSVANNLNDISKDHPDLALAIAKKWIGKTEYTDWIVKHAMRGLLKKGDKQALALFGHHDATEWKVTSLKLSASTLPLGATMQFSFSVSNDSALPKKCRIEYAIDYQKSNNKTSRKVFHFAKKELAPGEHHFKTTQRFQDFTTRKHYAGIHTISIIINGEEKVSATFKLTT
jgi:3-methyladenine DNA glycosylase AlkC